MDYQSLASTMCDFPGAVQDYKLEWEWDRFLLGGKMFAAHCKPDAKHAPEYAGHELLTLKCEPTEAEFLRGQYSDILPGFYMDKRNWISLRLDGDVSEELALSLAKKAYRLVYAKLTRKQKLEVEAGLIQGDE